MSGVKTRNTKKGENTPMARKQLSIRLSVKERAEVDRELEEGVFQGCNTPTDYIREVLRLRWVNANERNRQISQEIARLLALKPTQRELKVNGLDVSTLPVR